MGKPKELRSHKRGIELKRASPDSTHVCTHPDRQRRRDGAARSLVEWRKLTIDQQLDDLRARPGESKRQVARLTTLKGQGHIYLPQAVAGDREVKATVEKIEQRTPKAPPKSDAKATKAFARKKRENGKFQGEDPGDGG